MLVDSILTLVIVALGYLTDSSAHAPPTTGQYAYNDWKPGASGFPAVGSAYTDPVFGESVKRLTDRGTAGSTGDDMYAHHWANSNGTYFFDPNSNSGNFAVRRISDSSIYRQNLPLANHGNQAWHPTNPEIYFYFTGAVLHEYDLSAQTDTGIHTFAATLQDVGGSLNWIDGTGDIFLVNYTDGGSVKAHIWKRSTNTLYSGAPVILGPPGGWTALTPDGNYVVTAAGGAGPPDKEHWSYAIDHGASSVSTTANQFWGLCGDHGSVASASNGKNYFITFDCNYDPGIWVADITLNQAGRTAAQQQADSWKAVDLDFTMKADGHIAAGNIGVNKDWAFYAHEAVSAADEGFDGSLPNPWQVFRSEIVAFNVVTHEVRRYCHHRSRCPDSAGEDYWWLPRISCSWDGSIVLFDSNFNIQGSPTGYNDMYMIQFSGGSVPAPSSFVVVRR